MLTVGQSRILADTLEYQKAFTEQFLTHPEEFDPSEQAIRTAYCDFILKPQTSLSGISNQ